MFFSKLGKDLLKFDRAVNDCIITQSNLKVLKNRMRNQGDKVDGI